MSVELITVLLVEDDPNDVFLIEKMLNNISGSYYAFKIDHRGLLSGALDYLYYQEPDAILLDLGLPDARGMEILTSIIDMAPSIPIVVLTGLEDEKVAIEALQKGAQDYLIKGRVDPHLLTSSLRYAIERKRTEEARTLLAAIVESSDDAIISKTLGGIITSWNRGAEIMYGFTAQEAVGQLISLIIPPKALDEVPHLMERIRRGEHVLHCETARRRKNGEDIIVSLSISPLRNKGGVIIGASTIARDITQRKQAEDILLRYELLASYSRDIILFMRLADGRILEANAAATKAYGYSRAEMLNLTVFDLRAPHTKKLTPEQMAEADGKGALFQTVHRRRDGSTFPVEVSSRGATIGGSRTLVSVVRDITARCRIEEEREKLIVELKEALTKVKTLSGFLPICSSCKKIRDDQGYWQQIEAYIRDHSEADFSHGICPDCAKKLYPEFVK